MSDGTAPARLVTTAIDGDGVATVRLDNPPVNSMSDPLLDQLDAALAGLASDGAVGAVVLVGTGEKAFAAGADLPTFRQVIEDPAEIEAHTGRTRAVLTRLGAMPAPVVAAVQASAVGGGLELALACDLVVADERARLGLPEVGLGLIPGAGGTQRLARRVGRMRATAMILEGRVLEAGEALAIGLVGELAPAGGVLAAARERAARLAAQPRVAVREALRVLRGGAELPLEQGLDLEHDAFLTVLATADAREGIDAFLERRAPSFGHR